MALSDYTPETREIKVGKTSFFVKGVSLSELTPLIRAHLPDLEPLFDIFQSAAEHTSPSDIPMIAGKILSQAPGFCANLIAVCAGEPDQAQSVQAMPFPNQLEALVAIGDLTFNEVGGVKKGMEVLADLLEKLGLTKGPILKQIKQILTHP